MAEMTDILKLDFNERCDKENSLFKDHAFGEQLWRYPDRQPLEDRLAQLNSLSPSQVLCTNGGDEAIMILMRMIKENSTLILPLPAFSQYTWGVKSWQLKARLIEQKSDLSINAQAVEDAIKQTKQSVTILTRPNNPTGESIELDTLVSLIEASQQQQGWVFLDEAYIEFSDQESAVNSLLERFDNLVILRTLSKAYGLAGIRLGYLLGSINLISQFRERCMPFNISAPSLQIALESLLDKNQIDTQNYCQTIRKNRQALSEWLVKIGVKVLPSQANFVLLQLPPNQAKAVKSFMARNNVLLRTFNQEPLNNCLRITIPYNLKRLMVLLEQALQPKLICLDMDGVLIDTSESYDATTKATVKSLTGSVVNQLQVDDLKRSGGFNNDWVLTKQLIDDLGFDFSLKKVTEEFQQIYIGENNDGLVKNEKAMIQNSLVERINQSKQTTFSIVTGRPRKEAIAGQLLIDLSKLELISLDDVEMPKPSPEGINKLQSNYSKLSWMCGDNIDDMQAATTSNSLAIGIGKANQDVLYQAGADIVLDSINELEEWLCPIK